MAKAYQCDKCKKLYLKTRRQPLRIGGLAVWLHIYQDTNNDITDICDECALEVSEAFNVLLKRQLSDGSSKTPQK